MLQRPFFLSLDLIFILLTTYIFIFLTITEHLIFKLADDIFPKPALCFILLCCYITKRSIWLEKIIVYFVFNVI